MIEDACEGLGSTVGGRPLGSFGDVAVFAFYPNKQITTGEGGMVVTDDDDLADVMRSLRNQGRDSDGTWLRHVRLGYNYRLDEMSAAVGVAQLERLAELRAGRARVAAAYERAFGGADWITLPAAAPGESVDWFVYVVRLAPEIDRDRLIPRLAERGVPSRPYFSPIHLQPFYRSTFGFEPGDFPVTERVAASTLALPFSSRLTDDEVGCVAETLTELVRGEAGGLTPGSRGSIAPESPSGLHAAIRLHGPRDPVMEADRRAVAERSLCGCDVAHGSRDVAFAGRAEDRFNVSACGSTDLIEELDEGRRQAGRDVAGEARRSRGRCGQDVRRHGVGDVHEVARDRSRAVNRRTITAQRRR